MLAHYRMDSAIAEHTSKGIPEEATSALALPELLPVPFFFSLSALSFRHSLRLCPGPAVAGSAVDRLLTYYNIKIIVSVDR